MINHYFCKINYLKKLQSLPALFLICKIFRVINNKLQFQEFQDE